MPKKILFGVWLAVLAPGERPPGTPRWPKAPFLRHGGLGLAGRGGRPRGPCVTLAAPRCRGRGGPMPQRPRVTVLGSLNTDISLPVPPLPAPGETVLAAAAATFGAGGKGANQAVAA